MTIEIATEQSVLVELTAEDLQGMHLTYELIGTAQAETEKAWKTILYEIRQRTGRVYSDREVEIDMLPSRGGGCLMIVSAQSANTENAGFAQLCLFEDADALMDFLSAFYHSADRLKIELYRLESGAFAALTDAKQNGELLIREFGTLFRLTNQQLAAVKERAERLKVFCSF